MSEENNSKRLEAMDAFFDARAGSYDSHMLDDLGLAEFYEAVTACFSGLSKMGSPLDLGCGTGLELKGIFRLWPRLRVIGIDLSGGMLEKLREKYPLHRQTELRLLGEAGFHTAELVKARENTSLIMTGK